MKLLNFLFYCSSVKSANFDHFSWSLLIVTTVKLSMEWLYQVPIWNCVIFLIIFRYPLELRFDKRLSATEKGMGELQKQKKINWRNI